MIRFKAIVIRVVKELVRYKRTLALMLIAPIFILTMMNFVFDSNSETHVKIGYNSSVPSTVVDAFPSDKVKMEKYDQDNKVKETIKNNDLDAFVALDNSTFNITYENEDPNNTTQIQSLFNQVLTSNKLKELSKEVQKLAATTGQSPQIENFSVENAYVYGSKDSSFFDKILPILIGFFVFFFVFLISGIALLKERTSGTLERLLATPVRRSEIIFGYLAGYGIFAIIQTLIIVLYSVYLLNLEIAGNFGWVLAANILIALVALVMGIFVSTFANSEFQMVQFIPLVVIPQVFFSGIIPFDTMADWVQKIGYVLPLSYGGDALSAIMVKGQGFDAIKLDLGVLLLFVVIFTILNIVGLKKYRKV